MAAGSASPDQGPSEKTTTLFEGTASNSIVTSGDAYVVPLAGGSFFVDETVAPDALKAEWELFGAIEGNSAVHMFGNWVQQQLHGREATAVPAVMTIEVGRRSALQRVTGRVAVVITKLPNVSRPKPSQDV